MKIDIKCEEYNWLEFGRGVASLMALALLKIGAMINLGECVASYLVEGLALGHLLDLSECLPLLLQLLGEVLPLGVGSLGSCP